MNDQEFENLIRKNLKQTDLPDRASLKFALEHIEVNTEKEFLPIESPFVKVSEFAKIWKTKRAILVPSLIVLIVVGIYSLSPSRAKNDASIKDLVVQDESVEESGVDYDDLAAPTDLNEPAVIDLTSSTNAL